MYQLMYGVNEVDDIFIFNYNEHDYDGTDKVVFKYGYPNVSFAALILMEHCLQCYNTDDYGISNPQHLEYFNGGPLCNCMPTKQYIMYRGDRSRNLELNTDIEAINEPQVKAKLNLLLTANQHFNTNKR